MKKVLEHPDVGRLIELALDEDGIQNDLTSLAASSGGKFPRPQIRATIISKQVLVACGYPMIEKVLTAAGMASTVKVSALAEEGAVLGNRSPWIVFEGPAFDLLRVERTILNFLIRMSGIATYTRKVVEAVAGTPCQILHTRKTAPGHRRTDIYAALVGGAHPHRRSLDDAILVKENHIRSAASFQALVDGINQYRSKAAFVEIEVSNFVELKYSMLAKPDRVMLDNFSLKDIERAVALFGAATQFEASGNITLENVRQYAETGVDFVSLGSLTHSAPSADLSMLFDHTNP